VLDWPTAAALLGSEAVIGTLIIKAWYNRNANKNNSHIHHNGKTGIEIMKLIKDALIQQGQRQIDILDKIKEIVQHLKDRIGSLHKVLDEMKIYNREFLKEFDDHDRNVEKILGNFKLEMATHVEKIMENQDIFLRKFTSIMR